MSVNINIFNESSDKFLPKMKIERVVRNVLEFKNVIDAEFNIVLCSDEDIHKINVEYLNHDYPTDVISFNLEEEETLSAEIYISVDTAKKQANEYKVSLSNELLRLTAHGTLHIVGYDDNDDESRNLMHTLENRFIDLKGK